jgi:hypothetical protein
MELTRYSEMLITYQSIRCTIPDDYICPVFLLVALWNALPLVSADDVTLSLQIPCDILGLDRPFRTAFGKLRKKNPVSLFHRHVFSFRCVQVIVLVHVDNSLVSWRCWSCIIVLEIYQNGLGVFKNTISAITTQAAAANSRSSSSDIKT